LIVAMYIMNGIRVNGYQDRSYGLNIKQYKFQYLNIYVLSLNTNMSNLAEFINFQYNVYFTTHL